MTMASSLRSRRRPAALPTHLKQTPHSRDLCHSFGACLPVTLASMRRFSILTNRKRAVVALVHSIVFLLIAARQMLAATPVPGVWAPQTVKPGTWILCGIFAIVSAILLWLLVISSGWMEKFYFAFCTASAGSGLLRTVAGDQAFHAGIYIRVGMLISAVLVGFLIVHTHSPRNSKRPGLPSSARLQRIDAP